LEAASGRNPPPPSRIEKNRPLGAGFLFFRFLDLDGEKG
jgi:hypothetical protein